MRYPLWFVGRRGAIGTYTALILCFVGLHDANWGIGAKWGIGAAMAQDEELDAPSAKEEAKEETKDEAKEAPKEEPKEEVEDDAEKKNRKEEVEEEGDEPAKDSSEEPKGTGPGPDGESMLVFFFKSLGWLYSIIFLMISFVLVALVVMNLLAVRRENIVPVALVQGFEAHLNEKRYQEAYELAKTDDSFLGQVLSAGLAKLQAGYAQAIEAMQEVGEEETMRLEHRLSYIALVGAISPMVGLLGTVDGMVASFMVIAKATVAPKPSELAAGISTALITTLVGLWLAIPAIALFGILRNRVQRLTLEVGVISEQLMSRFQNVGMKKSATP